MLKSSNIVNFVKSVFLNALTHVFCASGKYKDPLEMITINE